jgi:hypothetical protein
MAKNKIKIPTAYDQRPDATGPIIIALPLLPISANGLFKNTRKGRARTKEYDSWLNQMALLARNQCKVRMPHRANISILVEQKSERRDIDNTPKAVHRPLGKAWHPCRRFLEICPQRFRDLDQDRRHEHSGLACGIGGRYDGFRTRPIPRNR